MTCSAVLQSLVEQHLSLFLYEDAKFYAERLYYEDPRPEHLHLLAQSYFRQGKIKQAYLILQTSNLLANLYLFALCCTQLGKFNEAENALLKGLSHFPSNMSNLSSIRCSNICNHSYNL